ncbi:uncharacterized protein [Montipora foliosa]|uniref:uncharacterized protein n=1 Tax=Montipora foliosa TaxID=591990 RepID=UPI0035F1B5DF
MISFLGKWLYSEEAGRNPSLECFVNESEEGDWLLIDIELTNNDGEFLKDYVVVPVICRDGEKLLSAHKDKGIGKSLNNIKKCQKFIHGKMISRLQARRLVLPYRIEHPLRLRAAVFDAEDMRNLERLQQFNCWLKTMMMKDPQLLGTLGNTTFPRVKVQSPRSPVTIQVGRCTQVIEPMKLHSKHAHWLVDDLNTCKSLVKYDPSPLIQLLSDLKNLNRKQSLELVVRMGDALQEPLCVTVAKDHVCKFVKNRPKSNSLAKFEVPCADHPVVISEPTRNPVPLLALEWIGQQQDEEPADYEKIQQNGEKCNWLAQPAISVISDICEMTSRIGYRVPQVAIFLWAQLLQFLSCSRKYFCRKQEPEVHSNGRTEITGEPKCDCYLTLLSKGFSEDKCRAAAEKKTKRQDTKKNLKRAHAAMVQKHCCNTNRKRAMDCARFRQGNGKRGC